MPECGFKWLESISKLIKHYRTHLDGQTICECIFKECQYSSSSKSGFDTHLSRVHPNRLCKDLPQSFLIVDNNETNEPEIEDHLANCTNEDFDATDLIPQVGSDNLDSNQACSSSQPNNSITRKDLYNFFITKKIRYKDQILIPKYACNEIYNDMEMLLNIQNSFTIDFLNDLSKTADPNQQKILTAVFKFIEQNNVFSELQHNHLLRNQTLKEITNEFYVEPKQVVITSEQSNQSYNFF
jgi:hypothetical protein